MKLHKSVRLFADKHLENIGTVFQTLYKDEILTDCTLYCKDGSIKAHKVILAASSRYFRNVFVDHKDDNAIFMYGISFIQLKNLVELIYKGSIDVSCDNFNSIFDLAEDLQVSGVLVEDGSNTNHNGFGRDTRYKGQKRVAVDFLPEEQPSPATKCFKEMDRRSSSSSDKSIAYKKEYENDTDNEIHTIDDTPSETIDIDSISDGDRFIGHNIDEAGNLSSWARKERKFKCDLCPSSFKRASHLSRHQLVHTGERPFACGQCDKAFSRHDKLKHHIHKAHELGALNDALGPDSLYTIDHVDILTPETSMIEPHASIMTQHQVHQQVQQVPATLLVPKVEPSYSGSNFTDMYVPQKKGRGRPRKYPPVPVPLVKRPRGRPRINPVVAPPLVKRPRGRPRRINPISVAKREEVDTYSYTAKREEVDTYSYTAKREEVDTYNFTNCPYNENMDYMTKPEDRNEEILPNQEMMEPLVEIKTEPVDKPPSIPDATDTNSFFENIGLFENTSAIAKIGECTISVATTSGAK